MKLNTILENFDAPKSGLKYKDLTSLQLHYLNKLASGKLDLDGDIPDNVQDVLDELLTFGLLDDSYELTNSGQKAVEIFHKLGGHDLSVAADRQAKLGYLNDRNPDAVDGVDDEMEDFDDDDSFDKSKF
jgi:hypothetical protein